MPDPSAKQLGEAIPDSSWSYSHSDETHHFYTAWLDRERGLSIQKKVLIADQGLQDYAQHLRDTSGTFSKRSIGAAGTPVAQIPMNMIFNESTGIAENIRKGNRDHLRWWLNRDESKPFRTFKYDKL